MRSNLNKWKCSTEAGKRQAGFTPDFRLHGILIIHIRLSFTLRQAASHFTTQHLHISRSLSHKYRKLYKSMLFFSLSTVICRCWWYINIISIFLQQMCNYWTETILIIVTWVVCIFTKFLSAVQAQPLKNC